MKRNILLIHLESLNMLNYRYNHRLFPNLTFWESKSVSFSNYYSTATSTLMVLSDIAYGGRKSLERCQSVNWRIEEEGEEKSILDLFIEDGYMTKIFSFPSDEEAINVMGENNFVGHGISVNQMMDEKEYQEIVRETINSKKPFLLWICNFLSNIDFDGDVINSFENGFSKWEKGYSLIDKEVSFLMEELQNSGKLSNTTVVFYGDHGDEVYTHGLHGGLTHAIEPYNTLIHTPMFIYDERLEPKNIQTLVCAKDLSSIVNKIVDLPERKIDIKEVPVPNNKYVYAKNMFVGQRVREKSFGKAYSVTDGRFMMMVTTRGLSMYETTLDPCCMHNLLCYYDMKNEDIVLNKEFVGKFGHHFCSMMNEETYKEINNKYNELYPHLQKYVENIYKSAGMFNRFMEMKFDEIEPPIDSNLRVIKDHCTEETFDCFERYFIGKKVLLYGAGRYGEYCVQRVIQNGMLVAWVDSRYREIVPINGFTIQSPDSIIDMDYDIIYIAINDSHTRYDVCNYLRKIGVSEEKII